MKQIGTIDNGDIILQVTREENYALINAQAAVNGLTMDERRMQGRGERLDTNLKQFFFAMEAFVSGKFLVNELEKCTDYYRSILGIEKPMQLGSVALKGAKAVHQKQKERKYDE